jgi:hypothetical protein
MDSLFLVRRFSEKAYSVTAVASLLLALSSSVIAFAQSKAPTFVHPPTVDVSTQQGTKHPIALSREERQKREVWHKAMSQIPLPKKGCFKATYPSRKWQERRPMHRRTATGALASHSVIRCTRKPYSSSPDFKRLEPTDKRTTQYRVDGSGTSTHVRPSAGLIKYFR